jgi:hypothetical protein
MYEDCTMYVSYIETFFGDSSTEPIKPTTRKLILFCQLVYNVMHRAGSCITRWDQVWLSHLLSVLAPEIQNQVHFSSKVKWILIFIQWGVHPRWLCQPKVKTCQMRWHQRCLMWPRTLTVTVSAVFASTVIIKYLLYGLYTNTMEAIVTDYRFLAIRKLRLK